MNPDSLKFAKTHEWVDLQGDVARVGISDFAVKELTDVVHIELPDAGRQVQAGDVMGEIESVKAVSDLYVPLTGEIVEVNDALPGNLGALTDDPYGDGWMVKIRPSDPSQLDQLLDRAAYEQHTQSH